MNFRSNDSLLKKLNSFVGKSIWIGIRPEDIYDSKLFTGSNKTDIEVILEVVEPMGNEIFLYFYIDSSQCIARISAREKPEAKSKLNLSFNLDKLHFFDTETEKSI